MSVEYVNPSALNTPVEKVFSQVSRARGETSYRIAGQVAVDSDGRSIAVGDLSGQMRACHHCVASALESLGLTWSTVTHLLIFTTKIEEYIRHQPTVATEFYGDHPPPSTLVEVRRLAHSDWWVEIQADAVA